jgi:hypothetical protein
MTFTPNLIKYFPSYLNLASFDNFWILCSKDFIALPILLLALTIFYVWERTWLAWLRLGLVWGFVVGYVFIINVSNPDYTEPTYLENLYLPLTLFVAIPFAMELLPALEQTWRRGPVFVTGVLLLLLVGRLGMLWHRHLPYTAYQHWLQHLLAYTKQYPERKFIMWPDNVDPHRLRAGWPWWSLASETMMVSARHSPDSVQTVRVGWDFDQLVDVGSHPGVLLGPFETVPTAELPANYCRFPNTTYRALNTQPPQDTAALRAYIASHQQVALALAERFPGVLRAGKLRTVQVRVSVPAADQPLHSGIRGPYPTLLRTAFYKAHDWPSDSAPLETALEVDVRQPWTQTLAVQTPHKPGHYTFEVSLVSKNYRDWPVRLRVPVEVVE